MSRTDNRTEAMKFIRLNLLNYDFDDLVDIVAEKFRYTRDYALELVKTGGMTLRERLDMQDELRLKRLFKNKKVEKNWRLFFNLEGGERVGRTVKKT